MSEQELTPDEEVTEEPSEPAEADYEATPDEQGGSQEHSGDGGGNLDPGSVRGEPDAEPSGLDVPGAWRGPDEPDQVGNAENESSEAASEAPEE